MSEPSRLIKYQPHCEGALIRFVDYYTFPSKTCLILRLKLHSLYSKLQAFGKLFMQQGKGVTGALWKRADKT